jgi:hypothetical protein
MMDTHETITQLKRKFLAAAAMIGALSISAMIVELLK